MTVPTGHAPSVDGTEGSKARRYGEAAIAGRGEEAERIALDCLVEGMSVADIYEGVISPAMGLVGDLWEAGAMTIADEHLASALNLKVMAAVYGMALAARPQPDGRRVLLAGVEGDRHGVGIRMAGDVLELAGFEVLYLGENVPTEQIVRSLAMNCPDLAAVGVPTFAAAPVGAAAVEEIRARFPDLPILVGGYGAPAETRVPGVATAVTLGELVERAEALTTSPAPDLDPPPAVRLDDATWRRRRDSEASAEDRFLEIAVDAAEAARENARTAEAYRRLAYQDPLTGVANRRAFEEQVAAKVALEEEAILVMVDIDHFKQINDRGGHLVGDRVLRTVASLLEATAGEDDSVARLGGDEFALLLTDLRVIEAARLAERFMRSLRADARAAGATVTCGISRLDGDRRQALIAADLALYRGKARGGGLIEVAPPS
jgi:MerR family transcriptional regulator, light-induced transcriptional regulator